MHEKIGRGHNYWFQILFFFRKLFLFFCLFFPNIRECFQMCLSSLCRDPNKASQNYFSSTYAVKPALPHLLHLLPCQNKPKSSVNWEQRTHPLISNKQKVIEHISRLWNILECYECFNNRLGLIKEMNGTRDLKDKLHLITVHKISKFNHNSVFIFW